MKIWLKNVVHVVVKNKPVTEGILSMTTLIISQFAIYIYTSEAQIETAVSGTIIVCSKDCFCQHETTNVTVLTTH